jgi:two-component system nitrate/nitrite sensor histidine kinase NarX
VRNLSRPVSPTRHPDAVAVNPLRGRKLFTKIAGVLAAVVALSLIVIGLSVYSSWKLEGVAAAINDAGSLRMRSWKIAHHLARLPETGAARNDHLRNLRTEVRAIEAIQAELERGNPQRPLYVPGDDGIPTAVVGIGERWRTQLKPVLEQVMAAPDGTARADAMHAYEVATDAFVLAVNTVIRKMELSYARSTAVLRTFQGLLAVLAVAATLLLMLFFFHVVIRPVRELQEGMRRMEREDFGARVSVRADDEFSELSRGFNRMAEHLQDVYATLEERVDDKTRRLNETNRELRILYDVGRFLREPLGIEALSRGFIEKVRTTFGAEAASVRLFDHPNQNLVLASQGGMDEDFVAREAIQRCGECLCGQALQGDLPVLSDTSSLDNGPSRVSCASAGFATVGAIPVSYNKRPIGLFNLFFKRPTALSQGDTELLQTLGQHLGLAIENVRLQSREREMAVSEERHLIACELHDSIAQSLASLNLQVQVLKQGLAEDKREEVADAVEMIQQGVQEGYADVRELLQHFRTRFDQPDLDSALRNALDRFSTQGGATAEFRSHGAGAPLGAEIEAQILYIVQEALSNARKHAQATQVRVDLWRDPHGLRLDIADDGVGFEQVGQSHQANGEHIGLQIMRERAERIGANLEIASKPGAGTRIALRFRHTPSDPGGAP